MILHLRSLLFLSIFCLINAAVYKRSIDLINTHGLISDSRLPREVTPNNYILEIQPFISEGHFTGNVKILVTWQEPSDKVTLNAQGDLDISDVKVTQVTLADEHQDKNSSTPLTPIDIKVKEIEKISNKKLLVLHLERPANRGTQCEIQIKFSGKIVNETTEALFRSSYVDPQTKATKWFAATYLRPNLARRVFPCFDEPAYKVPFVVKLIVKKEMMALSNMPLETTKDAENQPGWTIYQFQQTPPMSTFSLGFVISEFSSISINSTNTDYDVKVWARPDFITALTNVTEKVINSLKLFEKFWGLPYPLPKLDVIAIPNFQATKPADSWGLLLFKESELSNDGHSYIARELCYQWLGSLATPYWWSDAHINNALVQFVTASVVLKLESQDVASSWPRTMLYSIYYEFSKRYPHGKSMAIRQDTTASKTVLVFRMLNYTLGEKTFKTGLQKFMMDRQYKTFFADDIWSSLTDQARQDGLIDDKVTINEIAASWVTQDRLPMINVTRNYNDKTALFDQRVYLRERPHDVPDKEKYIWWVPIVLMRSDKLNFQNMKPTAWMKREKEIILNDMPDANQFIIVNPEEIGIFPVNYDETNWNLLANYLRCPKNRENIPVNTRAKLVHDAWNLAYAGDLSFGVALNMTLVLEHEKKYSVWDSVFIMIDHIGRHIETPSIKSKFQEYVKYLVSPLYQELGPENLESENENVSRLRSAAKSVLCSVGYKPCIAESQQSFKKWMEMENPDEGNPLPDKFLCPVFKWGTRDEWEFGLRRVATFPADRKKSERTYLLKTLAGCPNDPWKIERLLNVTIIEQNGNFTDNDLYLIFNMLTGSSNGYTSLFNFLQDHWEVKARFEKKPHLWNGLVSCATKFFKTKEGLEKVSKLYQQRKSEFGTADFVVEKALKNIQEETKWSNQNLPVIEATIL